MEKENVGWTAGGEVVQHGGQGEHYCEGDIGVKTWKR